MSILQYFVNRRKKYIKKNAEYPYCVYDVIYIYIYDTYTRIYIYIYYIHTYMYIYIYYKYIMKVRVYPTGEEI